ncbi:MAG: hypothetical protein MZW92_61885 [Comamonadaceae bacterium]|nr:hypothetical protein [Comamonadaceae bacterium]
MPSFAVRNFGCRVNQAEAFAWADAFRSTGPEARRRVGPERRRPGQFLHPDRPGRPRRPQVHPDRRPASIPRSGSSSRAAWPKGPPPRSRPCPTSSPSCRRAPRTGSPRGSSRWREGRAPRARAQARTRSAGPGRTPCSAAGPS